MGSSMKYAMGRLMAGVRVGYSMAYSMGLSMNDAMGRSTAGVRGRTHGQS